MILPSVMPDELARSLVSRMCVLNGAESPGMLKPDIASLFSSPVNPAGTTSWCDLLAHANRVTPQAFYAGHTLLPFRRAVRPAADCIPFGMARDICERFAPGPDSGHGSKQILYLCPECTNEDMNFWGFSYWRRSHQLPGSALCQKHQIGLHEIQTSSWRPLPHDSLKSSTPVNTAITKSAARNSVIQRYVEICAALAERTQPISTTWMVHVLKQRLQSHLAETGRRTRRLSTIAVDMIRGPWQKHFFPELETRGTELNSLDRTCSSVRLAYSTPFYALALAVLFANADDAMNAVNSPAIDTFIKQSNSTNTDTSTHLKGLPAAAHAFFGGATIAEASRSQGIEISQLEAFLRAAATPFTKLMAPSACAGAN